MNKYNKEELEKYILVDKLSYQELGKLYNVSGNAVKKWCIAYGLPSLKKDIVEYAKRLD